MTSRVDIRSSPMDSTVDHEASGVHGCLVAADYLALLVDLDHITGLEHAEMFTQPISYVSGLLS